jgi:homoserine O-acetyltransferase
MPYLADNAYQQLTQMEHSSTYRTLGGNLGHLEGVANIAAQADAIKSFLEKE